MKAKAVIFMGPNTPFELKEFELCSPPKGYAQMKLIASGVCGTDVHFHTGALPTSFPKIIGHEFVGKITEVNENDAKKFGLKKGDNVIADIAMPCGECLLCKNGDDANCVKMKVTNSLSADIPPHLYGGYAEFNFTPLTNLIKIPTALDPQMVATFACPGPTAIHGFNLIKQAGINLKKVNTAVVQGLGPVGIFALIYLRAMGVKTIYAINAQTDPERELLAKELGANEVLCLDEMGVDAVTAKLKQENDGMGIDLVFEASGSPKAIPQGMDILRNRGVYLVPGQYSHSGGIEIQPQLITFKALQIIGSSQYSICDVKDYLSFLVKNPQLHDSIKKLATCYPLSEVNTAFSDARARKNIKTLLVPIN